MLVLGERNLVTLLLGLNNLNLIGVAHITAAFGEVAERLLGELHASNGVMRRIRETTKRRMTEATVCENGLGRAAPAEPDPKPPMAISFFLICSMRRSLKSAYEVQTP